MTKPEPDIYQAAFVRRLFDEMSATYGRTNLISSLGFCLRWRKQCVKQIPINREETVYDLMSGMGELWPSLAGRLGPSGQILGVDFSSEMCERSQNTVKRLNGTQIQIREEDILHNEIPTESADVVVSSFGLKTFPPNQQEQLANEVARILKPGGRFSFLEISVPEFAPLRWPYMIYLKFLIPLMGRVLLGNPENYRLLGVYTKTFVNCRHFAQCCTKAGLMVDYRKFFFGCATGVVGEKPKSAS